MTWTRKPPTKAGWYWFDADRDDNIHKPIVAECCIDGKRAFIYSAGLAGGTLASAVRPGHWLGPLPVPEPPKK